MLVMMGVKVEVKCSKCGNVTEIGGLGRKPLAIAVTIVYDTLRLYRSVALAAKELNCSRGYIYKTLKENGLTVKEVVKT